jgi:hypothetical protein
MVTKVLYIIGKGRSGSTLLGAALDAVPEYFGVGELHFVWRRGYVEGRKCGCGEPIPECPVWSEAAAKASIDPEQVADWHDEIYRWRSVPRALRTRFIDDWPALQGYAEASRAVYQAVAEVTGARVLVDTSKWATAPGPLGLIPGIEAHVVQLVRDSRAVANSWQRRRTQYDLEEPRQMPRFGPISSSVSWMARNWTATRARRRLRPRSMLVRYEGFTTDPQKVIEHITRMVDEPADLSGVIRDGTITLPPNHTAAGNPARFRTGVIEIRPDVGWHTEMSTGSRAVVTAMTWPGLLQYRYPLRKR